jgi:hypothetical protein
MAQSKTKKRPEHRKNGYKYPAKFRMKLEKIAERAEQIKAVEQAIKDDPLGVLQRISNTLWHEFLRHNSVELMHAKIDDERFRLSITHTMKRPGPFPYLPMRAPWLDSEPGPPETPASS